MVGVIIRKVSGSDISVTGEAAGDIIYYNGTSWVRLAIGTARQALITNAGATAPAWAASLQSLMAGTGDIVQSSAANTPARLALGTASQQLRVNAGATALEYFTPAAGGGVWTEIAEASPTSGTNVEFASIATGYTEFWITGWIQTANTAGGELQLTFNNDATGGNYNTARCVFGGVAPTSANDTVSGFVVIGDISATAPKTCKFDIWISNHATGERKTVIFISGAEQYRSAVGTGDWENVVNEISNIDLTITGTAAAFEATSRIWLLGRTN